MTPEPGLEIDRWLAGGGLVVTASERAARAAHLAFHQRRRAEGLTAWPAPKIQSWDGFCQQAFSECVAASPMLLNPTQESAVWSRLAAGEKQLATLLEAPRLRLADLAAQAFELLCTHAPHLLDARTRSGWEGDAAAFSRWLVEFQSACAAENVLSPSALPVELLAALRQSEESRLPLLLLGFDRLTQTQQGILEAWGPYQALTLPNPAAEICYFGAPDSKTELAACAAWCRQQLGEQPDTRLLVLMQDVASQRGEIERAFLTAFSGYPKPPFEFSLGMALAQVPLVRAALFLLRWIDGTLLENELDWLFSMGLPATEPEEAPALRRCMRNLRQRNLQRPDWSLSDFVGQRTSEDTLPRAWLQRMIQLRRTFTEVRGTQQPHEWAALVPQWLQRMGWPGARTLTSEEHQATRRWEQCLDTCASLGYDGSRMQWSGFLTSLNRTAGDLLYAPESSGAPIQIAGPAESAGLNADGIWFMGASEDAWPSGGAPHPFIPLPVQREHAMPHASPRHDRDVAESITQRVLRSAAHVYFSYARQSPNGDVRPSRLILSAVGPAQPLPDAFTTAVNSPPGTIEFADTAVVPFRGDSVRGGANVLTVQSRCAFRAFAAARLGAQGWRAAEFGLTAAQRGSLLHAVMHSIWSGPPDGLRSHADLIALHDVKNFVAMHVRRVVPRELRSDVRSRMPERYLALEEERLIRLVTEWLGFEAARQPFTVAETELDRTVEVAGLSLRLRLDRIDRLQDGSPVVIDYKTGSVSARAWDLPRPEDVQLPLYVTTALGEEPGGLLFAKLRPGENCFVGQVRNPGDLQPNLSATSALKKNPLTTEQLAAWRACIEGLVHDFLNGRAVADPRDYPKTCESCDLQALCRITENRALADSDLDDEETDVDA